MTGLLIDPDMLDHVRRLFPDVQFVSVPAEELDRCSECPESLGLPSESVAEIRHDKWGRTYPSPVCGYCLSLALTGLYRGVKVPPTFVQVRLLREPVETRTAVAA